VARELLVKRSPPEANLSIGQVDRLRARSEVFGALLSNSKIERLLEGLGQCVKARCYGRERGG
jgi:hypothetical protein